MGIYDRDYYRKKSEKKNSSKGLWVAKWVILAFLALAFVVYILSIFSSH